jgi:hypothetical protein
MQRGPVQSRAAGFDSVRQPRATVLELGEDLLYQAQVGRTTSVIHPQTTPREVDAQMPDVSAIGERVLRPGGKSAPVLRAKINRF